MSNPFKADIFGKIKNIIRTVLWGALAVNCGILAWYSVHWTLYLCSFSWRWALRTLFAREWGL